MSGSGGGVLVIGGGQAAGRLVEALRGGGFDAPITLVGEESRVPYERPALSKEFLKREIEAHALQVRALEWYECERIGLRLGRSVVAIQPSEGRARLDSGEVLHFEHAVLATGSRPVRPPFTGTALPGVHFLRTLGDAERLREALRPGARVAVVGGGLIGLELASTACELGCAVTVLEAADRLLARVAAPRFSRHVLAMHLSHGVQVRTGTRVQRVDREAGALVLRLDDASQIDCDAVVIGVGAIPNTELAQEAGLHVDDGIVVDAWGRTSHTQVFAIGDCARFFHPKLGRHVRLESWKHAQDHAVAVAGTLLGKDAPYAPLPYAWSHQYGAQLQFVGWPAPEADEVSRVDPAAPYRVLHCSVHEDTIVGASGWAMPKEVRFVQGLIERRCRVDATVIARHDRRLADAVLTP